MATEVLLPKLGFAMNEGQISEWMYADGDEVKEGEILYLLEADKATNEIEAPASGKLSVKVEEGETVAVGTVIAVIE